METYINVQRLCQIVYISISLFTPMNCWISDLGDLHATNIAITLSDSASNSEKCPDNAKVVFDLDKQDVNFDLELNSFLSGSDRDVPVLLGQGGLHLKLWKNPNRKKKSYCFYHDVHNSASISLHWDGPTTKMKGSFLHKNRTHIIQPMSRSHQRLRRFTSNRATNFDHYVYPYGQDSKKGINVPVHRAIRATVPYNNWVEYLVVIDYSLFKRWYDKSNSASSQAKEDDAIKNLHYYYAYTVNEIDLSYRTIQSSRYKMRVVLTGYYIATTQSGSYWTENVDGNDGVYSNGKLDVDKALVAFRIWANQYSSNLPTFDHAALFTGRDMVQNQDGVLSTSILGKAYLSSVCTYSRVSVNEDRGQFRIPTVAAHELGHNLGAKHDGEENTCSESDQYIMTGTIDSSEAPNSLNIYTFSSCSVSEIYTYLQELDNTNQFCLNNEATVYDSSDWEHNLEKLPGQKYDLDDQCKAINGEQSFFCGTQKDAANLCQTISCNDKDRGCLTYSSIGAIDGSTCNDKRWCYHRECVYNSAAPSVDENCIFGDYKGLLDSVTCSELIGSSPWYCYHETNRGLCCQSCKYIYRPQNSGCEYGDKDGWCPPLRPIDCYANDGVCCDTCSNYQTGLESCKYGDTVLGCTTAHCENQANSEKCCGTCGQLTTRGTTTTIATTTTTASTSKTTTTTTTPTTTWNSSRKQPTTTTSTSRQTTTGSTSESRQTANPPFLSSATTTTLSLSVILMLLGFVLR